MLLPSEADLDRAIDGLGPADFQQLAERYAVGMYPAVFGGLAAHGRNARGQTIKGWPDAYVLDDAGYVNVVEATRDVKNWSRHLTADAERAVALPSPGLGSFVFVGWARTPNPAVVARHRRRLRALTAAQGMLELVFRQRLVTDLREPRFARVWSDLLGLTTSPAPWVELESAPIYGGARPGYFVPTRDEYRAGKVTRPRLSHTVEARLESDGWALVHGRGAAGKTVLATEIGWRHIALGALVYYLDVAALSAGAGPSDDALTALIARADDNVLFIVDNVHLDQVLAATIVKHWDELGGRCRLLLLGRQIENPAYLRGLESPMAEYEGSAIHLSVTPAMLRGMAARLGKRVDGLAPPSERDVQRWSKVFGGDLIAFGVAVAQALETGAPWGEIDATDARVYIRERYFAGLDERGRKELLLVADLSSLELVATDDMVDIGSLRGSLAGGVIERSDGGYRTIHPGMGELLLAAAGVKLGDLVTAAFADRKVADEAQAAVAAGRLLAAGRRDAAVLVLGHLIEEPEALLRMLLARGATGVSSQIVLLKELVGGTKLDDSTARDSDALTRILEQATLRELIALQSQANRFLPRLSAAIRSALPRVGLDFGALADQALVDPATGFPRRMHRVKRILPGIYPAIVDALGERDAMSRFFENTPGKLGLGRWRDLNEGMEASRTFRESALLALRRHPDEASRVLLAPKTLSRFLEAAPPGSPLRSVMLEHLRSSEFRATAVREALKSGPRRLVALLEYGSACDPLLLGELDGLADERALLEATAARWGLAPRANPRLLELSRRSAPRLHAVLAPVLKLPEESSG